MKTRFRQNAQNLQNVSRTVVFLILSILFILSKATAQVGIQDVTYQPAASAGGGLSTPEVRWYKFDGDVTDSSTNHVTGINNNSSPFVTGEDGIINHAISFNGSNQFVTFTATPALDTFTISCWVNPGSVTANYQAILYGNSATTGLLLHTSSVDFYNAGDHATGTVTLTNWYHLAVVCNAHVCQIYTNGVASGSTFTIASGIAFNAIGQEGDGSAPFFGYIDDVRIYSRPLSSTDIASLHLGNAAAYRAWRLAAWHTPMLANTQSTP